MTTDQSSNMKTGSPRIYIGLEIPMSSEPQNFIRLLPKTQRKAEKFSLKCFVCHVFLCKTLMKVKDVLLLLAHRFLSPVAR